MSTEVKNTLFRFVTMRAPELLKDTAIDEQFVRHPESEKKMGTIESRFLDAIRNPVSGTSRKDSLQNASNSVSSPITSRTGVKDYCGLDFFAFADWLTRNRSSFTKIEIDAKIAGVIDVTDAKFLELWDNLFRQIFTGGSSYARDGILSAIVARNFLAKYNPATDSIEKALKLAQARVVIPKELFGNVPVSKTVTNDKTVNLNELKDAIQSATLKDEIAQLESVLAEIETLERHMARINEKALNEAKAGYERDVKTAFGLAKQESQTYLDEKGIRKTYSEFKDLEIPEFQFTPEKDFKVKAFTVVSDTTTSFLSGLEDISITTFKDAKEFIRQQLQAQTASLMGRSALTENMVALGTTVIPQSAIERPSVLYSITKSGTPAATKLVLTLNGLSDSVDIIGANYSVKFNDNQIVTGTTFNDYRSGNALVVEIFNTSSNYFNPSDTQKSFVLDGTLSCAGGATLDLNEGTASIFSFGASGAGSSKGQSFLEEISGPATSILNRTNNFAVTGGGDYIFEPKLIDEINTTDPNSTETGGTTSTPTNGTVLNYIPSGFGISNLGIADYRRVEQEVCCYVPGEVSHIENVMAREYKEKSSRSLRRSEITDTTSTERESEKLTDTTSTDRFEMNQEAASVINEQTSIGSHAYFDGHYGTGTGAGMSYNFGVSADFAHNVSEENSNSQAVTQAKEITERALDRVVTKVKQERTTKMIEEYEENSKHGFDNRKGDKHISGVFRWVDKVYRNRILNYGKRLMYEFMIPEPAAFHNMMVSTTNTSAASTTLVKPADPRMATTKGMKTYADVTEANYAYWAATYNADVEPMPQATILVGASFAVGYSASSGYKIGSVEAMSGAGKVEIPDGYAAVSGYGTFSASGENSSTSGKLMALSMGGQNILAYAGSPSGVNQPSTTSVNLTGYKKEVPVSYTLGQHTAGDISVSVSCTRTTEALRQWQIDTFNAIISAYEEKLAEYEKKVAEIKQVAADKIKINPGFYRQIENLTLRKNCLDYLASYNKLGDLDLVADRGALTQHSKYDSEQLETYAAKVKFFEQAFEWDIMSYYFYPYYWAKQDQWRTAYRIENDDPLFKSFLQSGMARVILTVRPGFEEAVNWYMATGQVWNGGQVPTLDDPMYLSIVDELQDPEGTVEGEWESRVPTSLTVIQAGTIGLDVKGLPCDDDCSDYKQFDSDGNPVLDADGNPLSTNPLQQQPAGTNLGNVVEETESLAESISEIRDDIEEIKTALNIANQ